MPPLFNLNQNQQVTIPLPVPVELGGTGGSNAEAAQSNLLGIKIKKLPITTPATAGAQTQAAHGVTASKIVGIFGGYTDQFNQFIAWDSTLNNQTINVFTSGATDIYCFAPASTTSSALNRPGVIIILYED